MVKRVKSEIDQWRELRDNTARKLRRELAKPKAKRRVDVCDRLTAELHDNNRGYNIALNRLNAKFGGGMVPTHYTKYALPLVSTRRGEYVGRTILGRQALPSIRQRALPPDGLIPLPPIRQRAPPPGGLIPLPPIRHNMLNPVVDYLKTLSPLENFKSIAQNDIYFLDLLGKNNTPYGYKNQIKVVTELVKKIQNHMNNLLNNFDSSIKSKNIKIHNILFNYIELKNAYDKLYRIIEPIGLNIKNMDFIETYNDSIERRIGELDEIARVLREIYKKDNDGMEFDFKTRDAGELGVNFGRRLPKVKYINPFGGLVGNGAGTWVIRGNFGSRRPKAKYNNPWSIFFAPPPTTKTAMNAKAARDRAKDNKFTQGRAKPQNHTYRVQQYGRGRFGEMMQLIPIPRKMPDAAFDNLLIIHQNINHEERIPSVLIGAYNTTFNKIVELEEIILNAKRKSTIISNGAKLFKAYEALAYILNTIIPPSAKIRNYINAIENRMGDIEYKIANGWY